ncbi:MAG: PAS domain S-box protein, partial [Cyclobacteriaceae bacterium]
EKPHFAESIAIYTSNGLASNIVYDLVDTPCQNVIGADLCSYNANVQELFPKDELLTEMDVKSYIGIPLWDGNKSPIGLIAVLHKEQLTDVVTVELVLKTIASFAGRLLERIIYESKLKISEDRFNLLLQSSEDMITIHEPNGRYLYYNGPSRYPITPEDIVGKMPSDFFDKVTSEKLQSTFEKVTKTGSSETIELFFLWLGTKRWFSEYIYPVKNVNGEVVELVKVCRDIHDQKIAEQEIERQNKALLKSEKQLQESNEEYQTLNEELRQTNEELLSAKEEIENSEVKFRAIFDHSTDAIVVAKKGLGVYFNPAYLKLLGYENEEELRGKSITEQIAVSEREKVSQFIKERSLGYSAPTTYESRGLRKNGEEFDYEIAVSTYTLTNETFTFGIIRDITERKAILKELEDQAEKLNDLNNALNQAQELSHVGSWVENLETQTIEWSDETFRIWGFDPKKGAPDFDSLLSRIHPDDKELVLRSVDQAINQGTPYDIEHRICLPTGEEKILRIKGQTVLGGNGQVIRLSGMSQDITERKLAEENLRINEYRLALAIQANDQGVWDVDLKANTIFLTKRCKEIFGYTEGEIGNDLDVWTDLAHPEDLPSLKKARNSVINGEAESFSNEHRKLCKDGSWKWVQVRGVVATRDKAGNALRITGTYTDISIKKDQQQKIIKSEERLKEAQATAKIGNFEFVLDTHHLTWSTELYRICELSETIPPEKLYEAYRGSVHPDDIQELDRVMNLAIEKGLRYEYDHRIIGKYGRTKYVLGIGQPIFDANGKVVGIRGTAQDITQRKLFQQELDAQNKKLNELNRTLNQAQKLSKVGSWQWDMTSDQAEWSDEMYHIYGVSKGDFYPSNENVTKTVLPEDLHKVETGIGSLLAGKIFSPFEFRIRRPSGEIRNLYIVALEKGTAGSENEQIIFGVTQDITDRKEREKTYHHLAQIASNSTDMIYLINTSYQYLAANRSYLTTFGLNSEQLLSENLSDVMGEAYFKNVIVPNVKKCLEGDLVHYQTWYDFPKIGKKYMDIKYTKYLDNEGLLSGVAINSRDITFRKHAEDKVTRSLDEKELLLR